MKILMTGAAGMLASDCVPALRDADHEVITTDMVKGNSVMKTLDVRDLEKVKEMVSDIRPDMVCHLAAETDVDKCEQMPDHAYLTNTLGTQHVALACQRLDVPLLYVSTAGVFFGDKNEPYTEFDIPKPANVYGDSKLQGELIVRTLLKRHYIVRAGWMVGGHEVDKKFVYKIIKLIREGKKRLEVVSDKIGSPTFTFDFARNLVLLLKTDRFGLYHMTNNGFASRFEVAGEIVRLMNMQDKVELVPISSASFPLPAPRARSEAMRNYQLQLIGLDQMPHWRDSLKRYLKGVSIGA